MNKAKIKAEIGELGRKSRVTIEVDGKFYDLPIMSIDIQTGAQEVTKAHIRCLISETILELDFVYDVDLGEHIAKLKEITKIG